MMKDNIETPSERKPFFPGQSCFPLSPIKKKNRDQPAAVGYPNEINDQLNIIFDVIGTPEQSDLNYITDKRVLAYLQSFPKRARKDIKVIFPAAGEEALDLLVNTLKFSHQERVTLDDALKHSFFDKVRSLPDVQEANALTSASMLKKTAG